MECGNGFTGKVEWAGWDIYRWVAGGEWSAGGTREGSTSGWSM